MVCKIFVLYLYYGNFEEGEKIAELILQISLTKEIPANISRDFGGRFPLLCAMYQIML
jgi:hypothetical protein